MPPKRMHDADTPHAISLKEKLQRNAREQRNGKLAATNGSNLKEVDNVSQRSSDANSTHIKWSSQEASVLQAYRRAHRLDTPTASKNPLSHVVLSQGIGRFSPTMARPKSKRRVHKEQLAMAVRKHFNSVAVNETDVWVDWAYTVKHSDKEFRIRFAPQRK